MMQQQQDELEQAMAVLESHQSECQEELRMMEQRVAALAKRSTILERRTRGTYREQRNLVSLQQELLQVTELAAVLLRHPSSDEALSENFARVLDKALHFFQEHTDLMSSSSALKRLRPLRLTTCASLLKFLDDSLAQMPVPAPERYEKWQPTQKAFASLELLARDSREVAQKLVSMQKAVVPKKALELPVLSAPSAITQLVALVAAHRSRVLYAHVKAMNFNLEHFRRMRRAKRQLRRQRERFEEIAAATNAGDNEDGAELQVVVTTPQDANISHSLNESTNATVDHSILNTSLYSTKQQSQQKQEPQQQEEQDDISLTAMSNATMSHDDLNEDDDVAALVQNTCLRLLRALRQESHLHAFLLRYTCADSACLDSLLAQIAAPAVEKWNKRVLEAADAAKNEAKKLADFAAFSTRLVAALRVKAVVTDNSSEFTQLSPALAPLVDTLSEEAETRVISAKRKLLTFLEESGQHFPASDRGGVHPVVQQVLELLRELCSLHSWRPSATSGNLSQTLSEIASKAVTFILQSSAHLSKTGTGALQWLSAIVNAHFLLQEIEQDDQLRPLFASSNTVPDTQRVLVRLRDSFARDSWKAQVHALDSAASAFQKINVTVHVHGQVQQVDLSHAVAALGSGQHERVADTESVFSDSTSYTLTSPSHTQYNQDNGSGAIVLKGRAKRAAKKLLLRMATSLQQVLSEQRHFRVDDVSLRAALRNEHVDLVLPRWRRLGELFEKVHYSSDPAKVPFAKAGEVEQLLQSLFAHY